MLSVRIIAFKSDVLKIIIGNDGYADCYGHFIRNSYAAAYYFFHYQVIVSPIAHIANNSIMVYKWFMSLNFRMSGIDLIDWACNSNRVFTVIWKNFRKTINYYRRTSISEWKTFFFSSSPQSSTTWEKTIAVHCSVGYACARSLVGRRSIPGRDR